MVENVEKFLGKISRLPPKQTRKTVPTWAIKEVVEDRIARIEEFFKRLKDAYEREDYWYAQVCADRIVEYASDLRDELLELHFRKTRK